MIDLETHKFLESRDIVFHEDIFALLILCGESFGILFPSNQNTSGDDDLVCVQCSIQR